MKNILFVITFITVIFWGCNDIISQNQDIFFLENSSWREIMEKMTIEPREMMFIEKHNFAPIQKCPIEYEIARFAKKYTQIRERIILQNKNSKYMIVGFETTFKINDSLNYILSFCFSEKHMISIKYQQNLEKQKQKIFNEYIMKIRQTTEYTVYLFKRNRNIKPKFVPDAKY